jgi:hypothetical protein
MTPSRLKLIFKMISLAMDVGKGDIIKQVVAYGAHFKITKEETKTVLKMHFIDIYRIIHSISQPEQKRYITDPSEAGPGFSKQFSEEL